MNNVIRTSWRDAATLIVLSKKAAITARQGVNYDILFQTRTASASFANSVVFPGGVSEPSDASDEWLKLFKTFGYGQGHFDAFHRAGAPVTPILQDNPIKRHIALRITAIRETFEELGLLLCNRDRQKDRTSLTAHTLTDKDLDVKHWQTKVSSNPGELLSLCKELGCYPDIWALHYWSNWLTPTYLPKRFDTAFFVAAIEQRPELESSSEVKHVQWASPEETLEKCHKKELLLFPPQIYELNRLKLVPDCDELVRFAAARSAEGNALLYPVILKAKDGELHLLPGDELYPSSVDLNDDTIIQKNKTVLEIRESAKTLHRFEQSAVKQFIVKNCKLDNHIDMGDRIIPVA